MPDDGRRTVSSRPTASAAPADSVSVDTSAFGVPVGTPATVTASITCRVPFADLSLPGMPGSITVRSTGAAALDTYRARS